MDLDDFISIDLEDIADDFENLPEGVQAVSITESEAKKKDGSEYPYIALTMKPLKGSVESKFENKNLWLNCSMHPRALFNLKAICAATDIKSIKGKSPKQIAGELLNKELRVTIGIEPDFKNPEKQRNCVNMPYHRL